VPIVGRNAKFHSNLTQAGLFTAENAGQREEAKEEDISSNITVFIQKPQFSNFSLRHANYR